MEIIGFLEKGGTIVLLLILLNIIGFGIILGQLFKLYSFKKNKETIAQSLVNKIKSSHNTDQSHIDILILQEIKKLENGLNTIKIIATISPLLGLLGAVIVILSSFVVVCHVGLGDPMAFSGGISLALITTVVGLIVAIPHYVFYNYFIGALDNSELDLKSVVIASL